MSGRLALGGLEFGKPLKTTIVAKIFFPSNLFLDFCVDVEYFHYE